MSKLLVHTHQTTKSSNVNTTTTRVNVLSRVIVRQAPLNRDGTRPRHVGLNLSLVTADLTLVSARMTKSVYLPLLM